jgi:hypothetical protein
LSRAGSHLGSTGSSDPKFADSMIIPFPNTSDTHQIHQRRTAQITKLTPRAPRVDPLRRLATETRSTRTHTPCQACFLPRLPMAAAQRSCNSIMTIIAQICKEVVNNRIESHKNAPTGRQTRAETQLDIGYGSPRAR